MILILSIMRSLNQRVQARLLISEPHVMITFDRSKSDHEELQNQLREFITSDQVEKSVFSTRQDIILRNWNGRFHGATAIGLKTEDLKWYLGKIQKTASVINNLFEAEPDEVTIGADLADILGLYPGDHIHVLLPTYLIESGIDLPKLQKFKVGATLRSTISEIDLSYLVYNSDFIKGSILSSNPQSYIQLQFWLKNPDDAPNFKKLLEEAGYVSVQTWQERNASIFFALQLEKFMIGIFLTMAVLVAAFSLLMSLALLASQKRKDFILLRLLGFSPRDLESLYISLGLGLGSVGLIVGAIIGVATSLYLEWFPVRILPDIYHDSDISAKLDLGVTFGLLAGGFTILFLISLNLVKLLPTKNIAAALKNS